MTSWRRTRWVTARSDWLTRSDAWEVALLHALYGGTFKIHAPDEQFHWNEWGAWSWRLRCVSSSPWRCLLLRTFRSLLSALMWNTGFCSVLNTILKKKNTGLWAKAGTAVDLTNLRRSSSKQTLETLPCFFGCVSFIFLAATNYSQFSAVAQTKTLRGCESVHLLLSRLSATIISPCRSQTAQTARPHLWRKRECKCWGFFLLFFFFFL